jgi:alpha-beta hydrolase superfamily lysophospholipase
MKKNFKRFAYLLLFVTISASCKKDKPTSDPVNPTPDPVVEVPSNLVSGSPVTTLTSADIQAKANAGGFGDVASSYKYDVEYVKILYKTTYNGKEVQASGLLGIPKNTPSAPSILSTQHGTLFVDVAAPTLFPSSPDAFSGLEIMASAGFITAEPDYIGYGNTANESHPYFDMQYAASAVVDMLKASKAYLAEKKIATSDRLFLFGYSEGGYITMAAQKEIETNRALGLKVTAAAAGAGCYDLTEMLAQIAKRQTYAEPGFAATLFTSYNTLYGWNRPLTDFFQKTYADKIPGLLNGKVNRKEINNALSTSTAKFFDATFYKNLSVNGQETKLKDALAKNSFTNWVPKAPTQLFHGENDEAVYYSTSQVTIDRFKAAGATNVQLIPLPGATHQGGFKPMLAKALPWFIGLDK